MAITRTQQAKQMLQDGGMLVKPSTDGRRPGYRSAAFQSARSRSMSSGRSKSTGPSFSNQGSGDDNRQTYSAIQTQTGKVKGGGKGIGTDKRGNVVFEDDRPSKTAIDNAKKFQEEQKRKREETIKKSRSFNPFPIATSVLDKISNSKLAKYNNLLQRNNYFRTLNTDQQVALLEALAREEEIGTLNPMGITRNIDRGLEEGILGIGGGKFVTDIDFGGKDAKEVINKTIEQYNKDLAEGKLDRNASVVLGDDQPALTYDEYLENQMTRFDPGPSDDPTDPCLGPNPPAYCATRNTDPTTPPPPRQILTSRIIGSQFEPTMFAADGGRAGFAEGGIEQRLEQLGGDVSSAEKMLQGINERLQTAESSLGSGGGGLGSLQQPQPGIIPVQQPLGQPNAPFMGRPIMQPLLDQPLGQPLPTTLEAAQPGPNPFGIINSLTDSRGPAFDTMENAYKNAVDSSAEMKRIGRLDQLDVLGGRLSFEDYKKNFSMDDEGFVTRNPGSTPLGMQSPLAGAIRQGAMDGGIMDDDPTGGIMDLETGRQMYFLGKLVKKAGRAIKKVAKSPIGKAALLYGAGSLGASLLGKAQAGGGFSLGKGLGSFFGKGSFNPFLAKSIGGDTIFSGLGSALSKIGLVGKSGLPTFKGSVALAGILPFILKKDDEDEFDIEEYYRTGKIANVPLNKRIAGSEFYSPAADGGLMRAGYQEGGDAEPVAKKTMPLIDMDGMEKDYRETGGFVEMGRMERADDVPARLSKNEFVFTADAVRNAGDGDIDKGAEVMYNMMKNLEDGGDVSEESQGLEGARNMFQTSQRLGEVL